MRVALATCAELPHLDGDDAPLVAALRRRGVEVSHPVWDAGDAPFLAAGLTVIRSTWDYTTNAAAFVAWAGRVDAGSGGRLCNPASVVRWNSHKGYLLELSAKGVPIVPTRLLPAGTSCDLVRLAREEGWHGGVVAKPAVSAGSRDSMMVTPAGLAYTQDYFDRLLPTRDLLVQPFVPGIAEGELSLIYLEHAGALRFAHAVNKVPADGDFRSQPEFRAEVRTATPPRAWRDAAERALSSVTERLLYARVDLVAGDGGAPWLMELELIEPSLYLAWAAPSTETLADAIVERLR
ncbi:MAG: hypothetical protein A2138_00955 [Deltaproteobacteria bacterium RBG_16_71_12]|nr:MAG: hypothetical protein A2138_00955 [Deltaproteobacteria bacterium RBG_16_71_12]